MPKHLPKTKKFFTISETADFLGISIDTIRRYDKQGLITSLRLDGKNRYFTQAEIERFQASRKLSISEAAEYLHLSISTLRRLEKKGVIKAERNARGERMYEAAVLDGVGLKGAEVQGLKGTEETEGTKESEESQAANESVATPVARAFVNPFEDPIMHHRENLAKIEEQLAQLHGDDDADFSHDTSASADHLPAEGISYVASEAAEKEEEAARVVLREDLFAKKFLHTPELHMPKELPSEKKNAFRLTFPHFLPTIAIPFFAVVMILVSAIAVFVLPSTSKVRQNMAAQTAKVTGPAVLAEATRTLYDKLTFNIAAVFKTDTIFEKSITVGTDSTFNGNVTLNNTNLTAGTGSVTAANLVYSINAGTGVTITGDKQNPTISARSGFDAIKVGSDTLKPDATATTNTLELAAGSNISLSADKTTKKITITATVPDSSQWTTSGNDIYYLTGNIGIGTSSPGVALDVGGAARVSGALTLSSLSAGILHVNGAGVVTSSTILTDVTGVSVSLDPTAANTYSLGTSTANQYSTIYGQALYQNGSQVCDLTGNCGGLNNWDFNNGVLSPKQATVADLLLGGTSTASAKFAFINNLTGTPTASVSANSGNNALSLAGNGNITTTNRQTLTLGGGTSGNINLALAGSSNLLINGAAGVTQGSPSCVTTTNGIVTGFGTCQLGTEQWVVNSGAIYTGIPTLDLLLGGTSTASAKFAVLNMIGAGTPTASISANSGNNALYFDGLGNIATTNRQNLTLGNATTTGNINLLGGNVGIGTTTPNAKLESFATTEQLRLSYDASNRASFTVSSAGNLGISPTGLVTTFNSGAAGSLAKIIVGGSYGRVSLSSGENSYIERSVGATGITFVGDGNYAFTGTSGQAITLSNTTGNNPNQFKIVGVSGAFEEGINTNTANSGVLRLKNFGTAEFQLQVRGNTAQTADILQIQSSTGSVLGSFGAGGNLTLTAGSTGGNAAAIINQTGANTNDIFTASASGTTRLTLSNGGNLNLIGGVYQSGGVSGVTTGTAGCVTTTGGIVTGTASCQPDTIDAFWDQQNGAVFARNTTVDLLIGGTSTASAKFAFLNTNSGTPTASISGNSGNNALSIDGLGNISTTNKQNLTLGSASTGNIILTGGNVGIGTTTPSAKLEVAGTIKLATNATYLQGVRSDASITNLIGVNGANYNTIWSPSSGTGTQFVDALGANLMTILNGGNVGIGTTAPLSRFSVNGTVAGNALVQFNETGSNAIFTASQAGTTKFTIANNGDVIATSSGVTTDAYSFNASATTTGNAFKIQANALTTGNGLSLTGNALTTGYLANLSSTSTALTTGGLMNLDWSPGSATTATGDLLSLNIGANGILGNIFNVKDNGSSVFSVSQTGVTANLPVNFTSPGDVAITYDLNFTNPIASYINSSAPMYIRAGEVVNSSDLTLATYNKGNVIVDSEALYVTHAATVSGQLALGSTTVSGGLIGQFYATNASVYGKALAILDQYESQDILTGSASGITKFKFDNSGNLSLAANTSIDTLASGTLAIGNTNATTITLGRSGQGITLPGFTGQNGVLYGTQTTGVLAQATTSTAGLCLTSGASNPTWTSCSGAAGTTQNYWQLNSGALSPFTNSADLLLGGTSTDSAKFAFINNLAGTPTASISGNSGNIALYFDGLGNIGTTNRQDLTLGTATTGNLYFNPGGITAFTALASGNVGIGTTAPVGKLNVNGQVAGKSLTILNQTGDQAILTGSTAGVTKFVFNNDGNLGIGTTAPVTGLVVQNTGGGTETAQIIALNSGPSHAYLKAKSTSTSGEAGLYLQRADGVNDTSWYVYNQTGTTNLSFSNGGNKVTFKADGNVGIGTSTPTNLFQLTGTTKPSLISASGSSIGKALVIFNQTGDQAIFSASQAGATKFVIGNTGAVSLVGGLTSDLDTLTATTLNIGATNATTISLGRSGQGITLPGFTGQNGVLFGTQTTGVLAQATTSTAGLCLTSGASNPTWASCAASAGTTQNYWQLNSGALSPFTNSADLLLGGISTASAKFAFINNLTGTPTASISGNSGNIALSIDGLGNIATTNKQNLSLGNATTTGNILLQGGNVGIGTTTPSTPLEVVTALGAGGLRVTRSGVSQYLSLNESAAADHVMQAVGAKRLSFINDLSTAGAIQFEFDTNATTPGGGTRALVITTEGNVGIGTVAPLGKLNVNGQTAGQALVQLNQTGDQAIFTASVAGATKFVFDNNGNLGLGTTAPTVKLEVQGTAIVTTNVYSPQFNYDGGVTVLNGTSGDIHLKNNANGNIKFWTNALVRGVFDTNGNLGIGTTAPVGKLNVDGQAAGKALAILNQTGDQAILTGSVAGVTKFTITNAGNIGFAGGTSFINTLASAATAARTYTFPDADGTVCLSSNNCTGSGLWNAAAGAIFPGNVTQDLLLGGTSTSSAKFAFINNLAGSPTASIAGNLSLAVPTTAGANTFNLLNGSTLNFQQSPGGDAGLTSRLFINAAGNVGIGTTTPGARLDISDSSANTYTQRIVRSSSLGGINNYGLYVSSTADTANSGNVWSYGIYGESVLAGGSSSLKNAGVYGYGYGQTYSVGVKGYGAGYGAPSSGIGVGVWGQGVQTSRSIYQMGGYFELAASSVPPGISGAVVANSNSTGLPIFVGLKNGSEVLRIDQNGNLGIGTTSPIAGLQVATGNSGGNAAAIINQTGASTNDIFAASAAGATKFVIGNTGAVSLVGGLTSDLDTLTATTLNIGATNATTISLGRSGQGITLPGFTGQNGVLFGTQTTGVLAQATTSTAGLCLTSGASNPTWTSCSGAAGTTQNYWQLNSGALSPFTNSADLLLGGISTASAKFAFINNLTGTPTASISANSGNNALYFDGLGNIATTNKQNLTLGGASTGNIILTGGNVGIGTTTPSKVFDVNGDAQLSGASRVLTLGTSGFSGLYFLSSLNSILYGNNQFAFATNQSQGFTFNGGNVGIGTTAPVGKLNVNGQTAGKALAILNQTGDQAILTGSVAGVTKFTITNAGNIGFAGGTSFINTLASAATAARTYTFPDADGTVCLSSNNCTGSGLWNAAAGAIFPGNVTQDLLLGGTSTSSAKFAFINNLAGSPTASISGNSGNIATTIDGLGNIGTTNKQNLTLGTATTGSIVLNGFGTGVIQSNASGALSSVAGTNGQLLLGVTGGAPAFGTMSNDATITNAGVLTLKNTGTAGTYGSASQVPVFTTDAQGRVTSVTNTSIAIDASAITSGTLPIARGGTNGTATPTSGAVAYGTGTAYAFTLAGTTGQVLVSGGSGTPTWTDTNTSTFGLFDQFAGALRPKNTTVDFLLGGTSTASAKFAFINNLTGTPTASISGNSGNIALSIDGLGNIGTTNKQNLTLGTATTGSIVLNGFGTGVIQSNVSGVLSSAALNLAGGASYLTGLLPVANGGTGVDGSTVTDGQLLIGNDGANGFTLANLTAGSGISISNGSGAITISQTGSGSSKWTQVGGVLFPNQATVSDLLLGGTSTASAKFAFINNLAGSPTASIAGNLSLAVPTTAGTNTFNLLNGGNLNFQSSVGGDTGLTSRLFINGNTGYVGIGTTTPTTGFTVHGNSGNDSILTIDRSSSTYGAALSFAESGNPIWYIKQDYFGTNNNSLNFVDALGSTNLTLGYGGNVGIGTTAPIGKFNIDGQVAGKALTILNQTGDQAIFTASQAGATKFVIGNTGALSLVGGLTSDLDTLTATTLNIGATNATTISLGRSGQGITLPGFTGQNGVLFGTQTTGVLAQATTSTAGLCLTSGASNPTWTSCSGAAGTTQNYWQLNTGALSPFTNSADLLLGGTSTASAKFAFINNLIGTPTASIAGNLSLAVPTTAGANMFNLLNGSTLNFQSSVGGDAGLTSRLFINGNTGNIGIGTTAPSQSLAVRTAFGTASFFATTNSREIIINPSSGSIDITGAALALNRTGTTDVTIAAGGGNVGIGTLTASGLLNVDGQRAGKALTILNYTGSDQNILTASAGGITKFNISLAGNIGFAGGTSFINTLASAATAARTYTFPDADGTVCLSSNNCTGSGLWNAAAGAIFPGNVTQDLLLGGTSTSSAKFAFINNLAGSPTASIAGNLSLAVPTTAGANTFNLLNGSTLNFQQSPGGDAGLASRLFIAQNGNIGIGTTTPTVNLLVNGSFQAGNWVISGSNFNAGNTGRMDVAIGATQGGGAVPLNFTSGDGVTYTGGYYTFTVDGTEKVRINSTGLGVGTTAPLSKFNVNGQTAGQALVQLNQTGDQAIFTASQAGATKFVIGNTGAVSLVGGLTSDLDTLTATTLNIGATNATTISLGRSGQGITLPGFTGQNGVLFGTQTTGVLAQATTATAGLCLTSGASNPTWTSCSGAAGTTQNYWQLNNGALSPFTNSADLLLGGISTASAKFAFINNLTGTPTASISANSGNNALYFDGLGNIATTNKQNLTLGGASTGNIILTGGNVGIGTTTPSKVFDVNGDAQLSGASRVLTLGTSGFSGLYFLSSLNSILYGNNQFAFATNQSQGFTFNGGNVGIGTTAPVGKLNVDGQVAGKSLVLFNQTGNQDIFTASASGTTRLTLSNGGNLNLIGGVYQSGGVSGVTTGTAGCVTTTGGIVTGTASCQPDTIDAFWDQQNGAVFARNTTVDLLIGGTSTASAKFAFLNTNSGTPTASISGNSGNIATTIDGLGNIGTTNRQDLSLGTSTTGNLYLKPGGSTALTALSNGNIGIGTTTPTYKLDVNGTFNVATYANIGTYGSGTANVANLTVQAPAIGGGGSGGTTNTGVSIGGPTGSGNTSGTLTNIGLTINGGAGGYANGGGTANNYGINLILSSGAGAGTTNNYGLYITGNGANSGATNYSLYNNSTATSYFAGNIGIGITTPLGLLNVSGQAAGKALVGLNQVGDQAIFTASQAGATKFVIGNTGALSLVGGLTSDLDTLTATTLNIGATNATTISLGRSGQGITLPGFTGQNGVLYGTQTTGVLAQATTASTGLCLVSGASNPTWASCAASAGTTQNYWQLNSGALSPFTSSVDLLLGGTSTASAKFAFINNLTGTPTASISGNSGNIALSIDGLGNIATTNKQNLTLGNATTTGNINLLGGNVGIGITTPNAPLYVNAGASTTAVSIDGSNKPVLQFLDSTHGGSFGIQFDHVDQSLSFLSDGYIQRVRFGDDGNVGIGTTTPNGLLNVNGQAIGKALTILNTTGDQDIFTASQGGTTRFRIANDGTVLGGATNSYDLGASGTTFRTGYFGTDVKVGGQSVCLANGTNCPAGSTSYWDLISGALRPTQASVVDLLLGGTSTASAKFAFINNLTGTPTASISGNSGNIALSIDGLGNIGTTNRQDLTLGTSTTGNLYLKPGGATALTALSNGNIGIGTTTPSEQVMIYSATDAMLKISGVSGNAFLHLAAGAGNAAQLAIAGGNTFFDYQGSWNVRTGVNGPVAMLFDANGNIGIGTTTPVGKLNVSGQVAGKSLVTLNQTGDQDIFTASAAGTPIFSITNAGGLKLGSSVGTGSQCLLGGATAAWGSCGGGTNYFDLISGALRPTQASVVDLLLGGTSTASAKFAFINNLTGTPTASISGNSGNIATTIDGLGNIGTTNRQDLSLGTSTTGNLYLKPGGSTALTALSNGNVGIGTTTPFGLLNVSGQAAGKSLVGLNQTGNQDIFTASQAGVTKFTIANNGDITATSSATTYGAFSFAGNSVTTGNVFSAFGNALTTGYVANLSSTSTALTTGGLMNLDWSPGSATTATGDLLSLNIGANGILGNIFNVKDNGSSVFSVSQTGVTANLPVNFTSPGDVSIAYDLNFTNPTASYINSIAPLYLRSGEAFNSSDLTLTTYNKGNVQIDSEVLNITKGATVSGQLVLGSTTAAGGQIGQFYARTNTFYGKALAIFDQYENQDILTASASGTPIFSITNAGGLKLGSSVGTGSQCLLGGATAAWGSCGGGTNYFDLIAGALRPTQASVVDLLLGGTSTASAKFAFINNLTGTPTASISGNSGNIALSIDGLGNIATTNRQALTLGNATTTGNINILGGNVGIGTTTPGSGGVLQAGAKVVDVVGAAGQNAFLRILGGAGGTKGGLIIGNNDGSGTNYGQFTFDNNANTFTINQLYTSGYLGLGANSRSADLVIMSTTGSVGVGTTAPQGLLHVNGGNFGGNALGIFNQTGANTADIFTASAAGTPKFTIANDGTMKLYGSSAGNVGIKAAASTTSYTLTLPGAVAGGSNYALVSDATGAMSWLDTASLGGGTNYWDLISGAIRPKQASVVDLLLGGTSTSSAAFAFKNVLTGNPTLSIADSSRTKSINIYHDGTNGNINVSSGNLVLGSGAGSFYLESDILNDTSSNGGFVQISDRLKVTKDENIGNALAIINGTTIGGGELFTASDSGTTRFVIQSDGNVGIGTRTPTSTLYVAGGLNGARSALIVDQLATGTGSDIFTASAAGATKFVINVNGNVGIGTNTPIYKLAVSDSQAATASALIENTSANNTTGHTGLIIKMGATGSATEPTGLDAFVNFLRGDGKRKGQVVGTATGVQYQTVSADFAEYFKKENAQEQFSYGDVVCMGVNGGVTKCATGTGSIIGAITDRGAFVGNAEHVDDPSYVVVGLLGQLPVRVSDENGQIHAGDYLVSSTIPGVVAKSTYAGWAVGKALKDTTDRESDGRLLILLQPGWHDDTVTLAADGNLSNGTGTIAVDPVLTTQIATTPLDMQHLGLGDVAKKANALGDRVAYLEDKVAQLATGSAQLASGSAQVNTSTEQFDTLTSKISDLTNQVTNLQTAQSNLASASAFMQQTLDTVLLSASQSASLAQSLQDVTLNTATVSGNLMVLGRTTVSDLGVTGNITAGIMSINGLDGAINTIGQPLKIQSNGFYGVDFLNGKVQIATNGDITTVGKVVASEVETKKVTIAVDPVASGSAVLSASAGTATIPAGDTYIDVQTTALSNNSLIFTTPDTAIAVGTKKINANTFRISIDGLLYDDLKVNWWIIDRKQLSSN